MARAKWIFGAPPAVTPDSTPKPIPVISSADAKKFGFENFGNTCYANSVLQALYFCTPFRDLMLQSSDHSVSQNLSQPPPSVNPPPPLVPVRRKSERKTSISGQSTEAHANGIGQLPNPLIPSSPPTLFSALRSLFLHISTNPADKGTVAPRAFIDKLKEVNELFRSTMHQDAHEFLNYLLNKIVEEVEEEKKLQQNGMPSGDDLSNSIATLSSRIPPTVITATTSSNSGASPQDATLVHKLFEGVLTSETRCLTCETVSSRDESFLDLSIDIEQNSSVTACLRQFSASEMLCQKNKFFCDSCCDLQEAEKRMKIKKLPNVLALHLKRFKYQEDVQKYIKLAYRVAFPFELRLFNTVDDTDDADRLYNLFGIVVHIGNGPHHGHYVSIIKTLGTWLVFDDDNVFPITESDIPKYFGDSNSGSAYVLYYQAVDIDLAGLGLRQEIVEQPMAESEPTPEIMPAVPPGLVEGDLSDLSDPPFPITPAQSSPLLSFVNTGEKSSRVPLEVNVINLDPTSASLPTPTASGARGSKGLFQSMRRSPSTSRTSTSGPDPRRSIPDRLPRTAASSPVLRVSDDGMSNVPPLPPQVMGREREEDNEKEKPRKDAERKTSMWFGKRKSFKLGEKTRPNSTPSEVPAVTSRGRAGAEDSMPSHSSAAWFRTSAHPPRDKRTRRPSDPILFDTNTHQTFATVRSKSTVGGGLKPEHHQMNGYESPAPGSASSSLGSTYVTHSPPHPPPPLAELPPRTSSLSPVISPELHQSLAPSQAPRSVPQHKKSLSNLYGQKDRARSGSIKSFLPRSSPAAPPATTGSADMSTRPLPPVPLLPPSTFPTSDDKHTSNGHMLVAEPESMLDKGKTRSHGGETDEDVSDLRSTSAYGVVGLGSFADANHSTSTTSSASSNLKRATRKLSLSAPMLGFGKRDKEKHKEREREKEKEKGPPNSFTQFSMSRF